MKRALILSGGGARAAYQVGVLQALAKLLPPETENPFPIICGTSAGAINAIALASHPGNFREAVTSLAKIWQNLTIDQVYKHGWGDLLKGLGLLGFSLFNEGVGRQRPLSMLDNAPLWNLLGSSVRFENIDRAIASGKLSAISVTAMGYTSGESVSFFQGEPELKGWNRHRRIGLPTRLKLEHLLASSAIPTIFPAVRINREYFGDGALRQLAPISPALHLGAESVFVIGVSQNRDKRYKSKRSFIRHSPSMAQIVGQLFNSAFIDALEGDLEHLERINELIELVPEDLRKPNQLPLRPVDNRVISPSRPVDNIAGRKVRYLPKSLRFFLKAIGATAKGGGATAASYLLFHQSFIHELMELGYQDTMWEADSLKVFFGVDGKP
ncbi:patatin-like phospholipase family protein [Marinimicrobium sp. ABcell2]|uniref:patatin-like phospholipase family protein n=1 Tax=Marinimicrobium sp. ABcell2 TaxID=3069751 RepID=UPI0027ADADA6|nr:patatin-like phospholipase family protein [Marinimicrobium sp. ABcell2]MDQ2075468.1 patatin-like phospholipase family protein [Marinimicrobium sp. ABcell2]